MELRGTLSWLREQQDAARYQFICTELDLAITFCEVAATTKDPARYDRNLANAREARAAAVYFINCNHLESTKRDTINEKLLKLNSLLAKF